MLLKSRKKRKMNLKNKLKLKILFVTAFISGVLLFSATKNTYAFLNDGGQSGVNSFASLMLDLVLESDSEGFSIAEDLLPDIVSTRNVTVKNEGSIPFVFSLEKANLTGDIQFCNVLSLKLKYQDTTKYSGLLQDFIYDDYDIDADLHLDPGESADFVFELTIPSNTESTFSDKTCGFDINSKAWMEEYAFGQAYWDEEELTNSVESADWLIEMGYETAETLLDGEETDHPIGYCPVITIDHSQENDEALQIIKWNAVDGATEYKITPYTKNESNWDAGTQFTLQDGDDGFSVADGVAEYETSVPEGIYAYLIEAFDGDGNLIGATTPRLTGFTCTFTAEAIPTGSVVINEIMWGGSSEHELDEWIELRNTTDEEIDLTGWKIGAAGPSFHEIELTGTIPADGFFLITHFAPNHEQPNEKAAILDSIGADVVDDAMHLSDNGEQLILKDVLDNEIDKTPVIAHGSDAEWAEGEEGSNSGSGKWRTMERDDDPGDGTNADNGHTCTDERCNDETFWDDEGDDYGTPKAPNYSDGDNNGDGDEDEDEDEGVVAGGETLNLEPQNVVVTTETILPPEEEPTILTEPTEDPAEPTGGTDPADGGTSEI